MYTRGPSSRFLARVGRTIQRIVVDPLSPLELKASSCLDSASDGSGSRELWSARIRNVPHRQKFLYSAHRFGAATGFLSGASKPEQRTGTAWRSRERLLELRDSGHRIAGAKQRLGIQLARRFDRVRTRDRFGSLGFQTGRACELCKPALTVAGGNPHQRIELRPHD
jgi:hypothetical protein